MSKLTQDIERILDDNKAENIQAIDAHELTDVTENIIICSARSSRHAKALGTKLIDTLKSEDIRPYGSELDNNSGWLLIDYLEVVVHIMLPETREYYQLEKLWQATSELREQNEN